jgi:hypothetical protein
MTDASQPAAPARCWRIEVPNLVDDLDLDPYAFRLYVHARRVCGARGGVCYESTRTLADKCAMSVGKVSEAKRALVAVGLIRVKAGSRKDGTADEITVTDIWAQNHAHFSTLARQKQERALAAPVPTQAGGVHSLNTPCSGSEPKKHPPSGSAQPVGEEATTSTAPATEPPAPVVASPPPSPSDRRRPRRSYPLDEKLESEIEGVVGSRETARDLIRQFGPAACRQQLDWLPHRSYEEAGAFYATAVRRNYAEPTVLRLRREEQARQREKAAHAALARKQEEDEARARAARAAAVESWYAALAPPERAAVDAEIEREAALHPLYGRMKRGGPMWENTRRLARAKVVAAWTEGQQRAC